jgi:hypothetical protein
MLECLNKHLSFSKISPRVICEVIYTLRPPPLETGFNWLSSTSKGKYQGQAFEQALITSSKITYPSFKTTLSLIRRCTDSVIELT